MADPAAFGFRDTTHPCAGTGSCEGYLFWDQIHPAFAHARLAVALEVGVRRGSTSATTAN